MSVEEPDRPESWIETEEIRDAGADFGPAVLMVGLVLAILLLWALTR